MPCNSDYLRQNNFEAEMQNTARHCVYACANLLVPCPTKIEKESEKYYASDVGQVEFLCQLIRNMTNQQMNDIVYNGRDPDSRRLADWWDEHRMADAARIQEENREKELQRLYEQAIMKLSDEEIEALREKL